MKTEINHIFKQSSCLTQYEIERYVSGTLSENELRKVELHIADCPMCNDEIDGYSLLHDKNNLPFVIAELNERIDKKISEKKVIPLISHRKKTIKRFISIAASLILLLGAGFVINFYINNAEKNLSENSAPGQNTEENAIIVKSAEEKNTASDETAGTKTEIQDTKTVNNDKTVESVHNQADSKILHEESAENTGDSEELSDVEQENDEEIASDNEAIDKTEAENSFTEETKPENKDIVIAGLEKNMKLKSKAKKTSVNDQPSGNISFTTTRGVNVKNDKKSNKKEIEKYKSLRESALLSYSMKIYDEALKDFNSYLKYKPNDYEIRYKAGISYYNLQKYDNAIFQFNKVIGEGINKYIENAEWYKAKSLLKLGKNAEAKTVLNKIIVKNGKYQNQALDLLNSLE